ncbi:MAG: hypothetical protein ICV73_05525, partial [Acetobacteraceae bacterium]|nr:hypothetical protein [Acetobacteraceae bacterium]
MTKTRAAAAMALLLATALGCAGPPPTPPSAAVSYPEQNWTEAQRRWFYHTPQGTRLMPVAWFLALEQPDLVPGEGPRFAAPDHLSRFGFLLDPPSAENPHGLPVGFAVDDETADDLKQKEPVVGLTCAACHTGQVEFRGRGVRIDGGPAMTDLSAFQDRLGRALFVTQRSEPAFARFASRVFAALGRPDTPEGRGRLRARLDRAIAEGRAEREVGDRLKLYALAEGPGRLDALNRGGNYVFGWLLRDERNFAVADAPVSYPALWDAPWFSWAQYNGAIRQPMARNVAEALGVRGAVRLTGAERGLYTSTVRVGKIDEIERLLAGTEPGQGLRSPAWPEDLLGPVDRARAERGRAHHARLCAGCHEGRWTRSPAGEPELDLTMVGVRRIGTDPKAAEGFVARKAYPSPTAARPISAADGLKWVTAEEIARWYEEHEAPPELRRAMEGARPNEWRALRAYRARPLNGVWATAPYLHNGSVPNLYELLLPAERRSAAFHLGGREFDPVRVGFETGAAEGRFRFDASLPGNSNRGHEFRDGPRRGEPSGGPRPRILGGARGCARRAHLVQHALDHLRAEPEQPQG